MIQHRLRCLKHFHRFTAANSNPLARFLEHATSIVLNSQIQLLPFCSTVSQREGRFYGIKRSSGLKQRSKETIMSTTSDKPYEPISFAKKHRISVEDARNILDQAAGDKKAADKHARRVSV
jgi:hypothetical protein